MFTKNIKNVQMNVKQENEDLIVEAYASTFGNVDSGGDRIHKGAFKKTIKENKNRIKVLFNHSWFDIIGKPLEIVEDSKGLYTKTKFINTARSLEVYELAKEDIVNELSIGYDIVKRNYDRTNDVQDLHELKLFEYSFVAFAMNDQANVTAVKFLDDVKAGRILSGINVASIKQVIDILTALLESSSPESGSASTQDDEKGCSTNKPKKSLDFDLLLTEIKKMRSDKT
jgi:HK97 family phage prohead protease